MRARNLLPEIGVTLSLRSGAGAQPAKSSSVPQSRISVLVEGNGPDVILIPGLVSSRDIWAELAATLQKGHPAHLVRVASFAGLPAAINANP